MGTAETLRDLQAKFSRYEMLAQTCGLSVFHDLRNEARNELLQHQTANPTRHDLVKEVGWDPYCLMCSTMGRMSRTPFGWKCEGKGDHFGRIGCGNTIGFDLCHYPPPPITRTERFTGSYADSFAA